MAVVVVVVGKMHSYQRMDSQGRSCEWTDILWEHGDWRDDLDFSTDHKSRARKRE